MDQRRSKRHTLQLPASVRSSLRKCSARLSDISAEGCCITVRLSALFWPDQRIVIRIDDLEPIGGTVRRVQGQQIGVAFDRPLYLPVFKHLVERRSTEALVSITG
jgi:hypothetical protein